MKKNVITAMLTMMVLMASLPMTALAETTTIEPSDGDTANVIASADVTEEDLDISEDINMLFYGYFSLFKNSKMEGQTRPSTDWLFRLMFKKMELLPVP